MVGGPHAETVLVGGRKTGIAVQGFPALGITDGNIANKGTHGETDWEDEVMGNGRPVAPAWVLWGGGESGVLRPSWAPGGEFCLSLWMLTKFRRRKGPA